MFKILFLDIGSYEWLPNLVQQLLERSEVSISLFRQVHQKDLCFLALRGRSHVDVSPFLKFLEVFIREVGTVRELVAARKEVDIHVFVCCDAEADVSVVNSRFAYAEMAQVIMVLAEKINDEGPSKVEEAIVVSPLVLEFGWISICILLTEAAEADYDAVVQKQVLQAGRMILEPIKLPVVREDVISQGKGTEL